MNNVCAETERIRKNNITRIRERTLFAAYKLVSGTSQWNHPESEHIRSFSWHNIYIEKAVSLKLQHTQYIMQNNPTLIGLLSGHTVHDVRARIVYERRCLKWAFSPENSVMLPLA